MITQLCLKFPIALRAACGRGYKEAAPPVSGRSWRSTEPSSGDVNTDDVAGAAGSALLGTLLT